MTQLKETRRTKNGSSSQKDSGAVRKIRPPTAGSAVWKSDSQRLLKVLSTHKGPAFFFIRAQSHQFLSPLRRPPGWKHGATKSLILLQETVSPCTRALSPDTIWQATATVYWLGENCDPVSLALGLPGRPGNSVMTSSLFMATVAFSSGPLLSTMLSVSLGPLPPTSFVFEEKV